MQLLKNNSPLWILWICLTSTAPFIFYSWPGHPYKILTFACLLIMLLQLIIYPKRKMFDYRLLGIIIVQIVYYAVMTFYHSDFSHLNLCIQLISLFIIISYINGFIGFPAFVKSYIYIILAMGIGGATIFLLHVFIGIKPLFSVEYSEKGVSSFLWLTTTNVYFDTGGIRLIRYSGFFDEPGAFALYAIFAVVLNKVYLKNRKIEMWLIIVTIFTMSLAFYLAMFVYFLLFYLNKSSIKYLVIFPVVIALFYFYASNNTSNDTVNKIYEFTFKRFELDDSGGGLAGDSRADLSKNDKEIFYRYPILGSGSTKESIYGSNLFAIFAQFGLVGSMIYYAFIIYLFLLILTKERKERIFYLKILALILINLYHRPELSSVFSLLVIVSIIYFVKNESISYNKPMQLEA